MVSKIPTLVSISRDITAEDISDINGGILFDKKTSKLHADMIQDIRKSLGEVMFRKEYMYTKVTQYLARMYESIDDNSIIINALNRIKIMDKYTFTHSINTAFYSMFIAIWMGLDDQQIVNATQAGLLHDIGKIYIPNEILNKSGKLTENEYEIIKKHTLYGYFLMNEFGEFSQEVKRAVLFHHERVDSSGYPLNATSEIIGLTARIVAIADMYDAMTTDRVYKKGVPPIEAIKFLSTNGMTVLDKEIIKRFIMNLPIYDFKMNK
jgi:putative nucleotidyltransferase with HDIG domain